MQQLEEKVVQPVIEQPWLDQVGRPIQDFLNGLFHGSEIGLRIKDFLNGTWLAHPVHPMVTDVAVGAWTTALVLDGVESASGQDMGAASSTAVGVGIAGAAASAASGLADWSDTYADQRRMGLLHAITNTLALGLYGASLWRRLSGHRTSGKALSGAGFATLMVGAYLGGDLAYRLGTQVDRNAHIQGPRGYTPVMKEADLPPNRPTKVEVGGVPVLLVRQGGAIFALSDICSHQGCSLSEGRIQDSSIVCSCHGSTFNLSDGAVLHGPSPYAQPTYDVRVANGQIQVRAAQQ